MFAAALWLSPVPLRAAAVQPTEAAVPLWRSIRAAARDPRLAFFVGGGMFMIAVYGQWSVTLAPYLSSNIADGIAVFAYLVSINGAVVLVGNTVGRRFIERAGAQNAVIVGCILFALGELGFLWSTGFALVSAVLFAVGTRMPPPGTRIKVQPAAAIGRAAGLHLRGAVA